MVMAVLCRGARRGSFDRRRERDMRPGLGAVGAAEQAASVGSRVHGLRIHRAEGHGPDIQRRQSGVRRGPGLTAVGRLVNPFPCPCIQDGGIGWINQEHADVRVGQPLLDPSP